ncbi:hypothetical protein, partial [Corynebacterium sp. NML130628]|uniref:hypothetical protein n=1 Tax=Corynebacterium sp. NML130628 TaxID=1906333 RepID=UPI001160954C
MPVPPGGAQTPLDLDRKEAAEMLTIAKLHGESVAYYESTVSTEEERASGPDAYYSEDGTKPATA